MLQFSTFTNFPSVRSLNPITLAKLIKNFIEGIALISLSLFAPTSAFAGVIVQPISITPAIAVKLLINFGDKE
jgi:hypothetical protein